MEDRVATIRKTRPESLRVRVRSDDEADDVRGFCKMFGIRCIIDIDPTRPKDTTALDHALSPPGVRPPGRITRKKGET